MMKKVIEQQGSVRVDLVGGTLDLDPIALLLQNTVTLNMATTLKAKVILENSSKDGLEIYSSDYDKEYYFAPKDFADENFYLKGRVASHFFKEMLFVVLICKHFGLTKNLRLTLSSGAPAGSGLGGSSAMGVTLAKAIYGYKDESCDPFDLISQVRNIEEMILNRGVAGYQDYFPAVYGGILALRPNPYKTKVEQLFSESLSSFLSKNLCLVYSGKSRLSGINNWEVYKAFFDGDAVVVDGLTEIAEVSSRAYDSLKKNNYEELLIQIAKEGEIREKLFANIVTPEMKKIHEECQKKFKKYKGIKVCGAGGGGCFLLIGVGQDDVASLVKEHEMQILTLKVSEPLS